MKSKFKIFFAFLAFALSGIFPVFGQRLTYSIIKDLRVRPANENNYIGTECLFELKIPYVQSEQVQASIPNLPSGVSFVSLRRSDYFDVNAGAKIEIWFSFSSPGTYEIPPLNIFVNNRSERIKFEPVEILEDPRNREPHVIITFEDGKEFVYQRRNRSSQKFTMDAQTGKPLVFTISLQYAIQLFSFDWVIPKDAYLKQLKKIEFKTNGNNTNYSSEKIPIAVFEWEPLSAGITSLPEFAIVATSFNGSRISLSLPDVQINVTEGSEMKSKDKNENYFSYAFIGKTSASKKNSSPAITEKDCEKICSLRKSERHSFPFGKEWKARKDFESNLKIENNHNEGSVPLMEVLLICSVVFLLLALLFLILKKIILLSITAVLFCVSISLFIMVNTDVSSKYGVFKGGNFYSVPEVTAESVATVESGNLVKIEQQASGWVFVRIGNASGWIREDSVCRID